MNSQFSSATVLILGAVVWLLLSPLYGCNRATDPQPTATPTPRSQPADDSGDAAHSTSIEAAPPAHKVANVTDPDDITAEKRQRTLQAIPQWYDLGQFELAKRKLTQLLVANPDDVEVLLWLARIEYAAGRTSEAIEVLSSIPADDPNYGMMTLGTSADWLVKLGRYDEAIRRYSQIVEQDTTITIAHRKLASLLNRLGRRQLATRHLRALCLNGDITQAELASLISRSDASITNTASEEKAGDVPLGEAWFSPVGNARQLASEGRFDEAIDLLIDATTTHDDSNETAGRGAEQSQFPRIDPTAVALLGRLALDQGDAEATTHWRKIANDSQIQFADHWYALARLAMQQQAPVETVAALLCETVTRDPTDWVAFGLLENCMNQLGRPQAEQTFRLRALSIKRSILASNAAASGDIAAIDRLATTLETLGRPLEANAWRMIRQYRGPDKDNHDRVNHAFAELRHQRRELLESGQAFASDAFVLGGYTSAVDAAGLRRFVLRESGFSEDGAPTSLKISARWAANEDDSRLSSPKFTRRASAVGLTFEYHNAHPRKERDLQIYEQFGGAVAALDYDRNGHIDYYFVQSAGTPQRSAGALPNVLHSQYDHQFRDVTEPATADDRGYGLGVGVGDLNQDGFDDLIVGNFGQNTVLINQGDGTFKRANGGNVWQSNAWTSAAAVADFNNDGIPDVMEVNYLDDPAVFEVPPRNEHGRFSVFRGPESYRPAVDRMLLQQPDQSWNEKPLTSQAEAAPGLGVVVANFDSAAGNECFVANDTRPNNLWINENDRWTDVAKLRGCAYSSRGGSGASMGIAAADFDHNGQLDLHVTNFYNEPVHFYQQSDKQTFVDSAIAVNLYNDSMPVLGFGTAAIDFENDGNLDLAVLNGHIEDLRFRDAPFKMKPQLFSQRAGRFQMQSAAVVSKDATNYFDAATLGRALIRTDWNRDGRVDLLATHLDQPVELLENQTANSGNWLQCELVGINCERTAVGAVITVQTELGTQQQWLDSGDGYSCSDERIAFFGLADSQQIEQISVQWPDGTSDQLSSLPVNQRVLIVQGQPPHVYERE
ncbi:FG-GAP-like repeat-containing protein [Novipirellula maiorica]|uniref:FG-GAP-like repeat-containing protein n=1 Tax=Novipirellula maiorica TaxID=1265734 RepID=UPI00059491A6|nr:FG-GAP-like repeat-containing protein [Rhodopirellula maiorica]